MPTLRYTSREQQLQHVSNWLFAGSLRAGQRLADILSLLETAKANQLDPFVWLRDVLTRLPSWPNNRLQELLPYRGNTFQ
ncbi:transposase [Xenorhabdus khoisanae]|uniref:Transposase n=1 Tax=Xenorhabdus khoisanae TaxID=880157 RepID=A0A0J5FS66_9GAMM|nr:transposase [Xenorhabdus khoisanae]